MNIKTVLMIVFSLFGLFIISNSRLLAQEVANHKAANIDSQQIRRATFSMY